jgi:beta,beta-carotene 9',10'-dioxygenase
MTATRTHAGQRIADHRIGFRTLEQEVAAERLEMRGELPGWLTGTLARVTPAGLDTAHGSVRHWFDGLAMLHAFTFAGGRVGYANRYLRTRAYERAHDESARPMMGFANDPCRGIFRRVMTLASSDVSDNANVNLMRLEDEYLAMTETPMPVVFDPATLATLGSAAPAPGQVTTAHPHQDRETGELVNYAVHMGPRSAYRIYQQGARSAPRVVAEVPVREPAYMHSFALTERYAVLVEFPLVVNPLRLAVGARSFIESFRWRPERGTGFVIVDRAQGRLLGRVVGEPFFAFHHVNAYEDAGELVIDLCAYDDPGIIDDLYLDVLRGSGPARRTQARATLRRARLAPDGTSVAMERLAEAPFELPRIDYGRHNARPYRYVYGVGPRSPESDWLDQIVKVDASSGAAAVWSEPDCYPGEPVFVAAPSGDGEDEGALLSVVLDAARERSFLLVLDAASLSEIARVDAPHAIPFGFHGQYFSD